MSDFPKTCSLGHDVVSLADDAAVQTHLTTTHPDNAPAARDALTNAQARDDGIIPVTRLRDPLADWGTTAAIIRSIPASALCKGTSLTIKGFLLFLSAFGATRDPVVQPDVGKFLLDFFLYVLYTAASEEASVAGSFNMVDTSSSIRATVRWADFFQAAVRHFSTEGLAFTPRKLMRTCDGVFWKMWNDAEVHGLDEVREVGTPLSQRWRMTNGEQPPAYVPVPQLFSAHLTSEEHKLRAHHQSTVSKVASGDQEIAYDGFDQVGQSLAFRAQKAQLARNIAGMGGSGSSKTFPLTPRQIEYFGQDLK